MKLAYRPVQFNPLLTGHCSPGRVNGQLRQEQLVEYALGKRWQFFQCACFGEIILVAHGFQSHFHPESLGGAHLSDVRSKSNL